jgi:hypothetical protein
LSIGGKGITPMLNITRTWNSVASAGGMRRGVALVRDFSTKRVAFGAPLSQKAAHLDMLAGLQAEHEAALHFVFHVVAILGREESGDATPRDLELLRLLTPIMKLTTARQAVASASETCEAFGGAGYVEDTGIPRLLRDAQVLSIWEGTTNVLALDTLRALGREGERLALIEEEIAQAAKDADGDGALVDAGRAAMAAAAHARAWLVEHHAHRDVVEAGARRFALTLGRALELALLCRHARWSMIHERDGRARASAIRFARHGVDLVGAGATIDDDARLARDEAIEV